MFGHSDSSESIKDRSEKRQTTIVAG